MMRRRFLARRRGPWPPPSRSPPPPRSTPARAGRGASCRRQRRRGTPKAAPRRRAGAQFPRAGAAPSSRARPWSPSFSTGSDAEVFGLDRRPAQAQAQHKAPLKYSLGSASLQRLRTLWFTLSQPRMWSLRGVHPCMQRLFLVARMSVSHGPHEPQSTFEPGSIHV